MSKIILMKYFPPARPKLVLKLKTLGIILKFGTFGISNIHISILVSKIIFLRYLPAIKPN